MTNDLLAACALGGNAGAESVCFTVFSIDELLSIICDEGISIHCKLPFIKFLVQKKSGCFDQPLGRESYVATALLKWINIVSIKQIVFIVNN